MYTYKDGDLFNKKGRKLGFENEKGYLRVHTASGNRYVHVLIWEIFNGERPYGMVVDHIDGNKANNKISNLRLVSAKENIRNRSRRTDNKYGFAGVSINHRKNRTSRRRAFYYDLDGKQIWKCFSISKYGNDEAFRLACEWRSEQIRLLNEQGAGYTERHGT